MSSLKFNLASCQIFWGLGDLGQLTGQLLSFLFLFCCHGWPCFFTSTDKTGY